jgi:hypothetical protein
MGPIAVVELLSLAACNHPTMYGHLLLVVLA